MASFVKADILSKTNIIRMRTRNKILIGIGVIAVAASIAAAMSGGSKQVLQTETVKQQDIKRTVLATGTVTSTVDLELGFKASGIVQKVPVKVGDAVKAGTVLAQLEQKDQLASVTQARATVAQAKANLDKVLSGATSEEVIVAQKAVDAAQVTVDNANKTLQDTKLQQATLVKNAYANLLNSSPAAIAAPGNVSTATITISGTYTGTEPAEYSIRTFNTGDGVRYAVDGPSGSSGLLQTGLPLPLARGLYMQFSAVPTSTYDKWTVDIPNMKAATYVANLSAYNASLETQRSAITAAENAVATAKAGLEQAIASLNLKKAQARPADVEAARAQLLSAQGQLQAAEAQLENTVIRAPANGTVTKIDIKIGEQASALKTLITLQDVGNVYVEANISEANIAQVKAGQEVSYTFDALGPDRVFSGTVTAIDPASTVVSGVVNYKVTAAVAQSTDIKPGMTANMSVLVGQAGNVLVVPARAIIEKNGKKLVRTVTDEKKQAYTETEVGTGLEGDGGLVEVKNGLTAGQTVVTFIEEKK